VPFFAGSVIHSVYRSVYGRSQRTGPRQLVASARDLVIVRLGGSAIGMHGTGKGTGTGIATVTVNGTRTGTET
jgi:hypothetical protein